MALHRASLERKADRNNLSHRLHPAGPARPLPGSRGPWSTFFLLIFICLPGSQSYCAQWGLFLSKYTTCTYLGVNPIEYSEVYFQMHTSRMAFISLYLVLRRFARVCLLAEGLGGYKYFRELVFYLEGLFPRCFGFICLGLHFLGSVFKYNLDLTTAFLATGGGGGAGIGQGTVSHGAPIFKML